MDTLIRFKGGTAEQAVELASVQVPDAWHAAEHLDELKQPAAADRVRAVWHLAHDLLRAIREDLPEPVAVREHAVEQALSWAHQNSYSQASAAINQYCDARGLKWSSDPMYNYVTYAEKGQ